jgi:hypothetical protein
MAVIPKMLSEIFKVSMVSKPKAENKWLIPSSPISHLCKCKHLRDEPVRYFDISIHPSLHILFAEMLNSIMRVFDIICAKAVHPSAVMTL